MNRNPLSSDSGAKPVRANLSIPAVAQGIHDQIVKGIHALGALNAAPTDERFRERYQSVMALLAQYQQAVIQSTDYRVSCAKGCSTCCYHWVEDVYSFEAPMMSDYIRKNMPHEIGRIVKMCGEDEKCLIMLQEVVDTKVEENSREITDEGIDSVDLLLAGFYQLRRPCPLLSADGCCTVYPVRPLTCRIYVNLSDPHFCDPEFIFDDEIRTYLLDMEESANALLDDLHARYDTFDGDTGLRSLLIKCLDRKNSG